MKGFALDTHTHTHTSFSHELLNQITILIFMNNYLSYNPFAANPPIILVQQPNIQKFTSPRHAALYRGKWRSVPRLRMALANKETPTANLTDTFRFNAAIASLRIIMVRVLWKKGK